MTTVEQHNAAINDVARQQAHYADKAEPWDTDRAWCKQSRTVETLVKPYNRITWSLENVDYSGADCTVYVYESREYFVAASDVWFDVTGLTLEMVTPMRRAHSAYIQTFAGDHQVSVHAADVARESVWPTSLRCAPRGCVFFRMQVRGSSIYQPVSKSEPYALSFYTKRGPREIA